MCGGLLVDCLTSSTEVYFYFKKVVERVTTYLHQTLLKSIFTDTTFQTKSGKSYMRYVQN